MRYVYLLKSATFAGQRYVGVTSDLKRRRAEHNAGRSPHTAKYAPWQLVTYVAFSDEQKAETFERYLKSGSGHAFASKGCGDCPREQGHRPRRRHRADMCCTAAG